MDVNLGLSKLETFGTMTADRKTEVVSVRMTPEVKQTIEQKAAKEKKKQGSMLVALIEKGLDYDKEVQKNSRRLSKIEAQLAAILEILSADNNPE